MKLTTEERKLLACMIADFEIQSYRKLRLSEASKHFRGLIRGDIQIAGSLRAKLLYVTA